MQDSPKFPAYGLMSDAARMWLTNAAQNQKDISNLTIQEQRQSIHAENYPAAKNAIARHQVSILKTNIADIPCLTIDPQDRAENRTVLYLFGGAFISGGAFDDLPISAALAAKTGARVICPQYRLAPEHPYPAALNDIEAVTKSVLSDDPNMLVAGESAGANLVLALIHRLRKNGDSTPNAAALLSPAADLHNLGETALVDTCNDPTLSPERAESVETLYCADQDPMNPEISPIFGVFGPDFPACFITTGTRDMMLSSCVRLTNTMQKSGANAELRVWEGMWHVFEFYPEIPESEASLTEISDFLKTHF